MNETENKPFNAESTAADRTIFRSKTFKTVNGIKYMNVSQARRIHKKLSKAEKKLLKKIKIQEMKNIQLTTVAK